MPRHRDFFCSFLFPEWDGKGNQPNQRNADGSDRRYLTGFQGRARIDENVFDAIDTLRVDLVAVLVDGVSNVRSQLF